MKRAQIILLALALLFGSAWLLHASSASLALPWWTADGGGGESSGGSYTLAGTIGQPDAGSLTGGPYSLAGGFWTVSGAAFDWHVYLLLVLR